MHFVDADAPKSQIQLHSRGNPVKYLSIPAGAPQHLFPSPRESRGFRGFRGIPAVPIPMQVSTTDSRSVIILYSFLSRERSITSEHSDHFRFHPVLIIFLYYTGKHVRLFYIYPVARRAYGGGANAATVA